MNKTTIPQYPNLKLLEHLVTANGKKIPVTIFNKEYLNHVNTIIHTPKLRLFFNLLCEDENLRKLVCARHNNIFVELFKRSTEESEALSVFSFFPPFYFPLLVHSMGYKDDFNTLITLDKERARMETLREEMTTILLPKINKMIPRIKKKIEEDPELVEAFGDSKGDVKITVGDDEEQDEVEEQEMTEEMEEKEAITLAHIEKLFEIFGDGVSHPKIKNMVQKLIYDRAIEMLYSSGKQLIASWLKIFLWKEKQTLDLFGFEKNEYSRLMEKLVINELIFPFASVYACESGLHKTSPYFGLSTFSDELPRILCPRCDKETASAALYGYKKEIANLLRNEEGLLPYLVMCEFQNRNIKWAPSVYVGGEEDTEKDVVYEIKKDKYGLVEIKTYMADSPDRTKKGKIEKDIEQLKNHIKTFKEKDLSLIKASLIVNFEISNELKKLFKTGTKGIKDMDVTLYGIDDFYDLFPEEEHDEKR